jgi:hypothetical protein
MLYNESKHNILAYQGKAKKPNISVVLPIQGYPKEKLKKGRRRKEGRKEETKKEDEPKVHAHVDVSGTACGSTSPVKNDNKN